MISTIERPPMSQRILIVDDHEELLLLFAPPLESEGYSVRTVTDGRSALRALDEEDFDLLICDIVLPDVNGYELLRRASFEMPVIVMSGNLYATGGAELFEKSARGLGGAGVLRKPFSPTTLVAEVRRVLADPESESEGEPQRVDDPVLT